MGANRHPPLDRTPGRKKKVNCANTEGIFRIIQSIPSPKAEPFKRWLAKVGYERVQEIEDPELGTKRTRALYKAKEYPDVWKRLPNCRGQPLTEDNSINGRPDLPGSAKSAPCRYPQAFFTSAEAVNLSRFSFMASPVSASP